MVTAATAACPLKARASAIFFEQTPLPTGKLLITVMLDTEGEMLNAYEGAVVYDPGKLELDAIETEESIVSLWPEEPHEQPAGRLAFAGGTIGGFNGSGKLYAAVFRAKEPGIVRIENPAVLRHDGKGTPVPVRTSALSVGEFRVASGFSAGPVPETEPTAYPTRNPDGETQAPHGISENGIDPEGPIGSPVFRLQAETPERLPTVFSEPILPVYANPKNALAEMLAAWRVLRLGLTFRSFMV